MQHVMLTARKCFSSAAVFSLLLSAAITAHGQPDPPSQSVEKIGVILFDKDRIRPARVENSALPVIEEAVKRLKQSPDKKLVLVGQADVVKDDETEKNGMERETEDPTGRDVRFEDLAAYRALNTKGYIVTYYQIDPSRILPTTQDYVEGQTVTFYLVPGTADFDHNFLGTTKTNEKPCTIKPCYTPDEETLSAQPRSRIPRSPHPTQ
jgi:hypothetical protein